MNARPSPVVRFLLPASACLLLLAACGGGSGSGNHAPLVTIDSPFTGNSFTEGDEVDLVGSATDPEDGALTGASLAWTSDLDGPLGTGESVTTSALTIGTHLIRLTATDASGKSGSAEVHIRVSARAGSTPRAGETNPYAGRLSRTPAKLDDELVLVGRSTALDQELLGIVDTPVVDYEGPSSTPLEPRITSRRGGLVPLAAAAGHPLRTSYEQAAIVQRAGASAQLELELVSLADPGDELLAEYDFQPPGAGPALAVAVADLDAFEEATGTRSIEPPQDVNDEYHDEVALAFADTVGGAPAARIEVLSFEDVPFPADETAPVPGPTSVTAILTTQPMHPASGVVLGHGDAFFSTQFGPHLTVAYVDAQKRVVLDVFKYGHTRADPHAPDPRTDARSLEFVLHVILSTPLSDAAVAAGGWDVVVGRGAQLGMNQLGGFDVVLVVLNSSGFVLEQAFKMEGLDGLGGPVSLGQKSSEFGRVPDGAGGEIGLTLLPDAHVDAELGRIVDNLTNRCEAVGLLVLADTDRGPVVQGLTAFIADSEVGNRRFGPVSETPAWIDFPLRPPTSQPTRASLAAGGFVSRRNGLIDDRGDPTGTGTEFAHDCSNSAGNFSDVNSAPFLGPMPSFYVADPEHSALHAVTLNLGAGGGGLAVTVPLDAAFDERAILLAADADGDAARYGTLACAGSGDCRRLFLGDAELHYVVEDVETTSVLLQQPPKHVDYLRALGGIVDVSMRDGYFAEFVQTDEASGSVTRKLKTDWSVGERLSVGFGEPVAKKYESSFEMALDFEHRSVQQRFSSSAVALSLTQSTGAVDDDVVWSKRQTVDLWRFPAQGGQPEGKPDAAGGLPDGAWMEISIPAEPETQIGPGTLNEDYQPTHMVGNILSYPTFAGDADDLGELFGFLGSYVPSDDTGARPCKPLEDGDVNGCLVLINGEATRVAEVLAGEDFIGGEFARQSAPIDVAGVLQIGGITYSAELEFDTTIRNGLTVTNNDTIKAEVNSKIPLSTKKAGVPLQFGEIKAQLRASASFENERVSENSVGSKTKIALHIPADIPTERSYLIRPSFGYTPTGGLKVSYQVDTTGAASSFWERNYGAPDPALHLPHRIVRTPDGFRLGTDFSRDQLKGFFVRDGTDVDPLAPARKQGPLLTEVPHAGDPVQLQVQVSNLSVATAVSDLAVAFSVQVYENGEAVGEPIPIGTSTIDFLPYRGQFPDAPEGHVASAYAFWDTTGFGPPQGQALVTYLVRVTLDPDDRIQGETHELFDRFADPLLGPSGEPLDEGLEKGQNNTGWALVRIAPSLSQEQRAAASSAGRTGSARAHDAEIRLGLAGRAERGRAAPLRGRVGEPLALSFELSTSRAERDYGLLQVFDGDPAAGGLMILSRTVQGLAEGAREDLVWRPRTSGRRVLHAVYSGTRAGDHPELQIPVVIEE